MVKQLIECSADPFVVDFDGTNPAFAAEKKGFFQTSSTIKDGASLLQSLRTNSGKKSASTKWFLIGFSLPLFIGGVLINYPLWFSMLVLVLFGYIFKEFLLPSYPFDSSCNTTFIAMSHALFLVSLFGFLTHISPFMDALPKIGFVVLFAAAYGYFNLMAYVNDPGFIPRTSSNSLHTVLERVERGDPMPQICPTCQIAKPLRATHCKEVGRCVARFDHFDIFLNVPIGWKNFSSYLSLSSLLFLMHLFFLFCSWKAMNASESAPGSWFPLTGSVFYYFVNHPLLFLLFMMHLYMALLRILVLINALRHLSFNLTAEEYVNWQVIKYLSVSGTFFNPFDQGGSLANITDFFKSKTNYFVYYFLPQQQAVDLPKGHV